MLRVGNAPGAPQMAAVVLLPAALAAELAAACATIERLFSAPHEHPDETDDDASVGRSLLNGGTGAGAGAVDKSDPHKYACTRLAFNLRLARRLLGELLARALLAASRSRRVQVAGRSVPPALPQALQLEQIVQCDAETRRRLDAFAAVVRHTSLNLRLYAKQSLESDSLAPIAVAVERALSETAAGAVACLSQLRSGTGTPAQLQQLTLDSNVNVVDPTQYEAMLQARVKGLRAVPPLLPPDAARADALQRVGSTEWALALLDDKIERMSAALELLEARELRAHVSAAAAMRLLPSAPPLPARPYAAALTPTGTSTGVVRLPGMHAAPTTGPPQAPTRAHAPPGLPLVHPAAQALRAGLGKPPLPPKALASSDWQPNSNKLLLKQLDVFELENVAKRSNDDQVLPPPPLPPSVRRRWASGSGVGVDVGGGHAGCGNEEQTIPSVISSRQLNARNNPELQQQLGGDDWDLTPAERKVLLGGSRGTTTNPTPQLTPVAPSSQLGASAGAGLPQTQTQAKAKAPASNGVFAGGDGWFSKANNLQVRVKLSDMRGPNGAAGDHVPKDEDWSAQLSQPLADMPLLEDALLTKKPPVLQRHPSYGDLSRVLFGGGMLGEKEATANVAAVLPSATLTWATTKTSGNGFGFGFELGVPMTDANSFQAMSAAQLPPLPAPPLPTHSGASQRLYMTSSSQPRLGLSGLGIGPQPLGICVGGRDRRDSCCTLSNGNGNVNEDLHRATNSNEGVIDRAPGFEEAEDELDKENANAGSIADASPGRPLSVLNMWRQREQTPPTSVCFGGGARAVVKPGAPPARLSRTGSFTSTVRAHLSPEQLSSMSAVSRDSVARTGTGSGSGVVPGDWGGPSVTVAAGLDGCFGSGSALFAGPGPCAAANSDLSLNALAPRLPRHRTLLAHVPTAPAGNGSLPGPREASAFALAAPGATAMARDGGARVGEVVSDHVMREKWLMAAVLLLLLVLLVLLANALTSHTQTAHEAYDRSHKSSFFSS